MWKTRMQKFLHFAQDDIVLQNLEYRMHEDRDLNEAKECHSTQK